MPRPIKDAQRQFNGAQRQFKGNIMAKAKITAKSLLAKPKTKRKAAKAPAPVKAKRAYKPRAPRAVVITAPSSEFPFAVGTSVFVRTVTMFHTGKVAKVTDKFLILEDAAWVADTGRFSDALKNGTLSEVEPFPAGPVAVSLGAVVDIAEWKHPLPTAQK
jgi:hypothetical protein